MISKVAEAEIEQLSSFLNPELSAEAFVQFFQNWEEDDEEEKMEEDGEDEEEGKMEEDKDEEGRTDSKANGEEDTERGNESEEE